MISAAGTAAVAGVGIVVVPRWLCPFGRMPGALVADRDFLYPCVMTAASIGRTWVDGVLIVDAAACRIALNDLYAHGVGGEWLDTDRLAVL